MSEKNDYKYQLQLLEGREEVLVAYIKALGVLTILLTIANRSQPSGLSTATTALMACGAIACWKNSIEMRNLSEKINHET